MATVYKCDRCGAEKARKDQLARIKSENLWYADYDLCQKCIDKLKEWMKQRG